ncbi:TPA: DUF645 family protein, partial [Vibrio cholerae]|nr:DUF645 family protein [Vibrio cholerae]
FNRGQLNLDHFEFW